MNKITLFAVMFVTSTTCVAIAATSGWGTWTDNEDKNAYAFLKNDEFKFSGEKQKWIPPTPQYDYPLAPHEPGRYITLPGETDGVWTSEMGICWIGDKKQQKGNLMIYVDTLQCCMMAQFLGKKLVLTEIWTKGADEFGICTNRVLSRRKQLPSE